jgi:hypothetical protein
MMNQRIGRWHYYGVLCRRKSQQVEPNRCSTVSKISIKRPIHIKFTCFRISISGHYVYGLTGMGIARGHNTNSKYCIHTGRFSHHQQNRSILSLIVSLRHLCFIPKASCIPQSQQQLDFLDIATVWNSSTFWSYKVASTM